VAHPTTCRQLARQAKDAWQRQCNADAPADADFDEVAAQPEFTPIEVAFEQFLEEVKASVGDKPHDLNSSLHVGGSGASPMGSG
jgi:hypothetical protein